MLLVRVPATELLCQTFQVTCGMVDIESLPTTHARSTHKHDYVILQCLQRC